MLHVRKFTSRTEREECKRWEEKRAAEVEAYQKAVKGTKQQRDKLAAEFFTREAREVKLRSSLRAGEMAFPSHGVDVQPLPAKKAEADVPDEVREDLERREAVARREIELKKLRTAPAYNKGGAVYWTEDMLQDIKGGGHRRR